MNMPKTTVRDHGIIRLGKQGENEVLQVIWRGIIPEWEEKYGKGEFQLAVKRSRDSVPYLANIALDGGDIVWTITSAETAQVGDGECELTYTVGDSIAKSQIWTITVCESLTGQELTDPPDPAKNWVDVVIKTASDAKQSAAESAESARQSAESATNASASATKAENAVGHSPIVGENGNWFVWDFTKSEYVDSGKPASTPPITPDTAGKYLTNNGSKAEWASRVREIKIEYTPDNGFHFVGLGPVYKELRKWLDDGERVYVNLYNVIYQYLGRDRDGSFYFGSFHSEGDIPSSFSADVNCSLESVILKGDSDNDDSGLEVYVNSSRLLTASTIEQNAIVKYSSHKNYGDVGFVAATPNVDYALPTLYVTIAQDGQDSSGNPIYKSDKTYDEIFDAYARGKEVKIKQVYSTGSFTSDIFEFLGIYYLKLTSFSNNTFLFEGAGIPIPEYGATYSFTFGQPVSECRVWIRSDNTVDVSLPMDFKTRLWHGRINAIPQQYLIHLNEEDNGTYTTLVADLSFDEIKTKFERTWGSTVFSVVYDNEIYAVSEIYIDSNSNTLQGFDFTNLSDTKKRLSLNNNNYWTSSIRPFTAKYFFLNEDNPDGYYLSNEEGKRVSPRDVSNQYGLIQYIYYQGFEYTLLKIRGPYIDFLAIIGDKYARISVDIAASYGQGTVTWSGWKPICPNQTPEVTTADNGKFLRVVDGQWAADSIAIAKGVNF